MFPIVHKLVLSNETVTLFSVTLALLTSNPPQEHHSQVVLRCFIMNDAEQI